MISCTRSERRCPISSVRLRLSKFNDDHVFVNRRSTVKYVYDLSFKPYDQHHRGERHQICPLQQHRADLPVPLAPFMQCHFDLLKILSVLTISSHLEDARALSVPIGEEKVDCLEGETACLFSRITRLISSAEH